jgi:hypothetical protein
MKSENKKPALKWAGKIPLTYILAVILLVGWAVGYLSFHVGKEIHHLLVLALIAVSANPSLRVHPHKHEKLTSNT